MILTDAVEVPWLSRRTDFPSIADSESGLVIVAGSGRSVWDDLTAYLGWKTLPSAHGAEVICVNDVGMHFPGPVKHWYSNDIAMLPKWVAARRPRYVMDHGACAETHSCTHGVRHVWPWPGHGSSSLNAVFTALALGYEQIVLCGVPLDDSGHYFDPQWMKTNFAREATVRHWRLLAPKFQGRVKSMSGNSREILGAPS